MYLFTVPGDSVLTHPWIEEASMSVRWTLFYMLFGYWWTCAFLHGLFHTCVSGIVGNWYFEKKQQRSARQAPQPSTRILGVKPCGMRDGIRDGAKRRRTPTQDPSTNIRPRRLWATCVP